jgi:hypothetical protein
MTGDERTRFCNQCSKHVYNLSDMSRDDAERLVNDTEGPVCVRFYRRADGTVLTADCPVGLWDVRTRFARLWASAAALVGFLTFGAITWGSRPDESTGSTLRDGPAATFRESLRMPELIMGKICPPSIPIAPPVQNSPAVDEMIPIGDPDGN